MASAHQHDSSSESQELLILQGCPDCVVLLDQKWSLLYANPAFRERFCGTQEPVGGNFLSYLDSSSTDRVRQMLPQLLQGMRQVELNHRTSDSNITPLFYSFFPLPSPSPATTWIAGIGRDRTADLGTLLEIIQLNIELERKQKELSEANARLEQLAITDQITQLYNRHYFFQVSQHFWEEARRYKLPLSTIMMDLDNFKGVNDNYGHLFGDHVLEEVSQRLRINTRKSDILARFGGEELILLAPNTDIQTAMVLGERLRIAVSSEAYVMGSCTANVTASLGISGTDLAHFESFEALLDSSDRALYAAKRAGKNCAFTYAASTSPTG
ncbi:MAG: sensor domain-containing diguanylate cyclase [Acidobacteria bacterium]|nr:sensor domain-containing diguanylate cyclase [Acidobacteriota bacterium]